MSGKITALASENLNPGLSSILEDVKSGNIRVPRFQRPFLWQDDQRLLLLESIRENMPIGSLLLWRTGKLELACFDRIGPHLIPPAPPAAGHFGWQYLLDGYQRVSTLLNVLMQATQSNGAIDQSDDDAALDWDIQYDLMYQEFIFVKDLDEVFPKPPLLPLWTLFDGRLVNKHMREMRKQIEAAGWTEQNFEQWEEQADQLAYRFQQYRIPVLVMTTDDLDLAARTFQRLNSQGTPMDETHLVTVLTLTPEFNLREYLAKIRDTLPPAWRDLDGKLFLQVCKGLIFNDIKSGNEQRLVKAIKDDPDLLVRATQGLVQAIDLLMRQGGVVREDLLPYSIQLVLLAVELVQRQGQTIPEQALVNWFLRTSWAEVFGAGASRRIKVEQETLRNIGAYPAQPINGKHIDWDVPKVFDHRYARSRIWMVSVASRNDLVDEQGRTINGKELLEKYGKEAFVKLFPEPPRASAKLKFLLKTPANRFLIDPTQASAMHKCLTSGASVGRNILYPHFIDVDELKHLHADNLTAFLEARNARIAGWVIGQYSKTI
jgi:Protein of unknown function DUF262